MESLVNAMNKSEETDQPDQILDCYIEKLKDVIGDEWWQSTFHHPFILLRYLILVFIHYAEIKRDHHDSNNYLESLKWAYCADCVSQVLDRVEQNDPISRGYSHNLDAALVFSASLRKFLKFRFQCKNEDQDHNTEKEDQQKEYIQWFYNYNTSIRDSNCCCNLFQSLYDWAEKGHFESRVELIKWYCFDLNLHCKNAIEADQKEWLDNHPERAKDRIKTVDRYYYIGSQNKRLITVGPITVKSPHQPSDDPFAELFPEAEQVDRYLGINQPENQNQALCTNQQNLHLLFYKGMVYTHRHQYAKGVETLESLLKEHPAETSYIRRGTLGLKARYRLASAYISLGRISEAKSLLTYVKESMGIVREHTARPDAIPDMRVLNSLVYCNIRQGNFLGGLKLFFERYTEPKDSNCVCISKFNSPSDLSFFMDKDSQSRRINGLNNLIFCLLLTDKGNLHELVSKQLEISNPSANVYPDGLIKLAFEELKSLAHNEMLRLHKKNPTFNNITYLLAGYYILLTGKNDLISISEGVKKGVKTFSFEGLPDEALRRHLNAHSYFALACDYPNRYEAMKRDTSTNWEYNISTAFHRVTCISAYLINLCKLVDLLSDEKHDTNQERRNEVKKRLREDICSFIMNVPNDYPVSLNAATALAEWLIRENEQKHGQMIEIAQKHGQMIEIEQLFRSFGYIRIYKEHGVEIFNQLRLDPGFRLFKSKTRGKMLAYLLSMYRPIMQLKEECAFHLDDLAGKQVGKEKRGSKELHLVHYTKLKTLKLLLSKVYQNPCEPLKLDAAADEPRFRLSNCGYLNDIYEGHKLLDSMKEVVQEGEGEGKEQSQKTLTCFQNMVSTYFPELNRSKNDFKPNASDVYVASLSVYPDSFSLGTIYSENESGCNVEFDQGFFDVRGAAYQPEALRDYLPPFFNDQEYPLYIINYIGDGFHEECKKYKDEKRRDKQTKQAVKQSKQEQAPYHQQDCHTRSIKYIRLCSLLDDIYQRWNQLDAVIEKTKPENNDTEKKEESSKAGSSHLVHSPVQAVRRFAADRLNEVRFLFKDSDYEFEGEVRVVYIDSAQKRYGEIDNKTDVPLTYVNMDRDLKNLTITLSSRVDDAKVNQIAVWLTHTGRVKQVKLAKRNRLPGYTEPNRNEDTD